MLVVHADGAVEGTVDAVGHQQVRATLEVYLGAARAQHEGPQAILVATAGLADEHPGHQSPDATESVEHHVLRTARHGLGRGHKRREGGGRIGVDGQVVGLLEAHQQLADVHPRPTEVLAAHDLEQAHRVPQQGGVTAGGLQLSEVGAGGVVGPLRHDQQRVSTGAGVLEAQSVVLLERLQHAVKAVEVGHVLPVAAIREASGGREEDAGVDVGEGRAGELDHRVQALVIFGPGHRVRQAAIADDCGGSQREGGRPRGDLDRR